MASVELAAGEPQWTSLSKKRGLDPLGMQTTSVALYQHLVPGISNVTLRMRYYGLYAWLADWYARNIGATGSVSWTRYVRRAEALYALACVRGAEPGIGGSRWAQQCMDSESEVIEFFRNTDGMEGEKPYLLQKNGAFGAAYGSQLVVVGILEQAREHEILVPTRHLGDRLATVFGEQVGSVGERFQELLAEGRVHKSELDHFAPMLPSAIVEASPECAIYRALLFGKTDSSNGLARLRANTLRLLLHVARDRRAELDVEEARWHLYGLVQDAIVPSSERGSVARHADHWRIYQANDLLHVSYEAVFRFTLQLLQSYPSGVTVPTFLAAVQEKVEQGISRSKLTWKEFFATVQPSADPQEDVPWGDRVLTSGLLVGRPQWGDVQLVEKALTLLAVLYHRFHGQLARIEAELPLMRSSGYTRSLVTELAWIGRQEDLSLGDFFTRLLRTRILERHFWVATQKLRAQSGDYTFLIEADEGRIRFRGLDGPVLTTPRLGSAIRFLQDVHLLNGSELTPASHQLLAEVEALAHA